jgi:phage gp36-like protein
MAYITLDEAKQFLGDLYESAYYDESTELPNDTYLQEDIDSGHALVNSYVKRQYNFVITGAESLALLKSLSLRVLKKLVYERYDSANAPEDVMDNYMDAVHRLKDLASGKLLLSDSVQSPKASIFVTNLNGKNCKQPVFTRDRMRGI